MAGGAAVAAAAAGCGLFDRPEPPKPDELQPVLNEAVALAAALEAAGKSVPELARRLAPLAADHRAHVAELTRVIGHPAPSSLPSASASAATPPAERAALLATLRRATVAAQRTAIAACRRAPATRAAVVGSIAACRATHAEALR